MRDGWIKILASDYNKGSFKKTRGRLLIGVNQLLVKIDNKIILVDTGVGEKYNNDNQILLGLETPRKLMDNLKFIGVTPKDIDIVILTHLHFDHAGGATIQNYDGSLVPTFTKALYFVQEQELRNARLSITQGKSDYISDDFEPLIAENQLVRVVGESNILPNVKLIPTPGHTIGHQSVLFTDNDNNGLYFAGDLISTRWHCNYQIATSYDESVDDLMFHRRKWLPTAIKNQWQWVFCHAVRDEIGIPTYLEEEK